MLNDASLSQDYWAKAVDTACYVMNKLSMSDLVDKTCYEAWASKSPSLAHLRVFGCDAFVHIPKEKRKKLKNKLEKCIFVRYKDGVRGYKLWEPSIKTVVSSKDAIFKEFEITSYTEEVKRVKEPKMIEFDLNNESHDLDMLIESKREVEEQTLIVRYDRSRQQPERYRPPNFLLAFTLSAIKEDPITVKEAID